MLCSLNLTTLIASISVLPWCCIRYFVLLRMSQRRFLKSNCKKDKFNDVIECTENDDLKQCRMSYLVGFRAHKKPILTPVE